MGETSARAIEGFRASDPVAGRTEWRSNSRGGGNISTHKLVRVGPDRLELKPSGQALMFYLLFIVLGLGMLLFGLLGASQEKQWLFVVIGLVFVPVGGWLLVSGTVPMVFDKRSGRFSREASSSSSTVRRIAGERSAALRDIHALQLLATRVDDSDFADGYYYCYELNLVLRDASRLHVVTYGNKSRLRADARALSVFLGRPVWDAIS